MTFSKSLCRIGELAIVATLGSCSLAARPEVNDLVYSGATYSPLSQRAVSVRCTGAENQENLNGSGLGNEQICAALAKSIQNASLFSGISSSEGSADVLTYELQSIRVPPYGVFAGSEFELVSLLKLRRADESTDHCSVVVSSTYTVGKMKGVPFSKRTWFSYGELIKRNFGDGLFLLNKQCR